MTCGPAGNAWEYNYYFPKAEHLRYGLAHHINFVHKAGMQYIYQAHSTVKA
jgi:hypothetical protein